MRSESCSFIWHPKVRTRYPPVTPGNLPGLNRVFDHKADRTTGQKVFLARAPPRIPTAVLTVCGCLARGLGSLGHQAHTELRLRGTLAPDPGSLERDP